MDSQLWLILGALALLLAVKPLMRWRAMARIRRLKLAVTPIALLDDRTLPPLFDEILVPGRAQLEALGFRYVASTREDSSVQGARLPYFTELFLHPEERAYAKLAHLVYPSIAWPFSLSFATWTVQGPVIETAGERDFAVPHPRGYDVEAGRFDSVAVQWARHRERVRTAAAGPLTFPIEALIDHLSAGKRAGFDALCEAGWMTEQAGTLRFTGNGARAMLDQISERVRRDAAVSAAAAPLEPTAASIGAEVLFLERALDEDGGANGNGAAKAVVLIVSAALFSLAFGMTLSAEFVAILLGVLLFHELGHLAAMKAFGYRDLSMFFIPFFGAAAAGRKDDASALQRAVVALAGPLPGLVLGFALLRFGGGHELAFEIGLVAVIVNYLNLLPVYPLDGGRVVDALLLSRSPRLAFVFVALSVAALAVAAWFTGEAALWILAALLGWSLVGHWDRSGWLAQMHGGSGQPVQREHRLKLAFSRLRLRGHGLGETMRRHCQVRQSLNALLSPAASTRGAVAGCAVYLLFLLGPLAAVGPGALGWLAQRQAESVAERDWEAEVAAAASDEARYRVLREAGEWFKDMEDEAVARGYFARALRIARGWGETDPRALDLRLEVAVLDQDGVASVAACRSLIETLRQMGEPGVRTARCLQRMSELGSAGSAQARIAMLREALDIRTRSPEQDAAGLDDARWSLIAALLRSGRWQEAEPVWLERLSDARADAGGGYALHSVSEDLAWFYIEHGRARQALPVLEEALAAQRATAQVYAPLHASPLHTALGWAHLQSGDPRAALQAFVHARAAARAEHAQQERMEREVVVGAGFFSSARSQPKPGSGEPWWHAFYVLDLAVAQARLEDREASARLVVEAREMLAQAPGGLKSRRSELGCRAEDPAYSRRTRDDAHRALLIDAS